MKRLRQPGTAFRIPRHHSTAAGKGAEGTRLQGLQRERKESGAPGSAPAPHDRRVPTGGCQGAGTLGQELKHLEPCSRQAHGQVLGRGRMTAEAWELPSSECSGRESFARRTASSEGMGINWVDHSPQPSTFISLPSLRLK